jgi:tRNA threonylcarbamoyladenosine biosynthesis protein TsaE
VAGVLLDATEGEAAGRGYRALSAGVRKPLTANQEYWRRRGFRAVADHGFWYEMVRPLPVRVLLPAPADTAALGRRLASVLRAGDLVLLSGDLGAGKTALVRAMLRALGVSGPVKSPTFTLLEPYSVSSLDFHHFDFYRFADPDAFGSSGFRDLFGPGRICAIEWPERAGPRLPTADISIALSLNGDGRAASITAASQLGHACLTSALEEFQARTGAG